MRYNQETVRVLYKKLLSLYPRAFREQLGESMEQTFNDLYNERKRQKEQGLFGFVLWMFIETARGIIRERVLLIKEMNPMKNILTNLRSSALISFLIVFPFIIMELVNRQSFRALGKESFPFPLFGILWLLSMLFVLTGMPILRNVRAGNKLLANPVSLLLGVVFLAIIAWAWGSWIIDQMPCFMGVPNCD
jgi:hypothetical protein